MPKQDSLELRILELVRDHYPITKDELKRRLGVSGSKMELALKRMAKQDLIELDVLPDKVYIRLKVIPVGPQAKRDQKREKERQKKGSGKDKWAQDYSYM